MPARSQDHVVSEPMSTYEFYRNYQRLTARHAELAVALQHALRRLNSIRHTCKETDFGLIEDALKHAKEVKT